MKVVSKLCLVLVAIGMLCALGTQAVAQQYLFVADYGHQQVNRYYLDGTPAPSEGNSGAKFNTFVLSGYPAGVAISPVDHSLYVNSNSHNYAWKVDANTGNLQTTWLDGPHSGLSSPEAMTFGSDGSLFVSNQGTHEVLRFDSAGNAAPGTGKTGAVFASGNGMQWPAGLAAGQDGYLYVSNQGDNSIKRFNISTGAYVDALLTGGLLNSPSGLVFGPDGGLYISNFGGDNVLRYDFSTSTASVFASAGLDGPAGIAFDASGKMYVSNWYNQAVQRYHTNGTLDQTIVMPVGSGLYYIAITPVPEPSSLLALLSGGIGILGLRLRRRS